MNDMDEFDKSTTYYLVPSNVSTKFEFVEGFGWQELKTVVVALAVGAILFFLTGFLTTTERMEKEMLSVEQTMGLDYDRNASIDGDYIVFKKDILPLPVRLLLIIIPTAGAYFFVKRDPSTKMSLISIFQFSRVFAKKQKRYLYKYGSGAEG